MSRVILLDVGHGNCAIVSDSDKTAIIDSPTGALLLGTLEDLSVTVVSVAMISHADKDHIAGVLSLLTSNRIKVERIYVNPDAPRRSKLWEDFRVAVSVAERKGSCEVLTSLSSTFPGKVRLGDTDITVVAPSAALALTGVGGATSDKRPVYTNTLSAVLRIEKSGNTGVLLAGDVDEVGLEEAIRAGANLAANVLVFPHHGGLPGTGDGKAFAIKLLAAVDPRLVVFSNGRSRHDNPRSEIVDAVCRKGCSVACTQLSQQCHPNAVDAPTHLEPMRALGKGDGICCAGSITLTLDGGAARLADAIARFQEFVGTKVATPMCRRGAGPTS